MALLRDFTRLAKEVGAENITYPEINIEKEAINLLPAYLELKEFENVVLIVDDNTRKAAGNQIDELVSESFRVTTVELRPNRHGQVIADEQTLVQLLVEIPNNTDVILAVGSGTIHDMVRFVSYKMKLPFISVPTAASVDGFTSKGAPLIFKGVKKTIQATAPIAVFADVDILKAAPQEMTAAGFGDMVGKYTSLLDWKISSLVDNEPYNQLAANLTRRSLEACVNSSLEIADHEENGLSILMQSLIESGLVMLVLDYSRPASGSEHHLSHYWEMELLKNDGKQLLHGAKVGIATTVIIDLYKQLMVDVDINNLAPNCSYSKKFITNWVEIKSQMEELPTSSQIKDTLYAVGGPRIPEDLRISDVLITRSLNEAFHLRERCTGLFLVNQFKLKDINYPIEKLSI
ncbi:glycerol-1-phosphate dehydrogenase [NAD(P)+] [Virgibacillus subterraneus]|uniref:Glycerol-1-phosphate dehydrogenase [NAD(P)+] n=1 Tax=Virgibacillus subterraneus TaxID=621109 RepID=A0A1H9B1A1_9BACI|nr:sn-glycerol-1-phosphate dehydrogenase [Virgibacillus subterraneus]SEP82605.1 glycerol-1-phosphate dehydrogenase [NAD(P)+] [Virgibacillus subterraneus]